ncbi:hypothetical protein G7Y79_00005g017810 [Physcia stellaris]|nr:hypothetical protein G7Y79_00005g017810 [Physcia stellaris]
MTFSELKSILDPLNLHQPTQLRARVGWVRRERRIHESLERLQWSKTSLNLILTTLTCASMDQATESVATLRREIQCILQSNQDLSSRLRTLEFISNAQDLPSSSSLTRQHDHGDDSSTIVPKRRASVHQETTEQLTSTSFAFDFDKDLYDSWVYSRALRRNRSQSLSSSAPNSFAWSCLSDLSLADISNVSLMSLPIMGDCLGISELYGFKKQIVEPTATLWNGQPNFRRSQGHLGITLPVDVLLHGIQSSGKTTIHKQMQILYGKGFHEAERMIYRTVIKKFWREAILAIATVETDQEYIRPTVTQNTLPSTRESQSDLSKFGFCHRIGPGLSGFQSCPRCCQNLATDPRIPRCLLTMGNVPYFATRLDEISSDGYIPTDSDILHATIGSTVRGLSVFEIDSIRHRVWDSTKTPPRRVSETITEFSYVIYTASLIDYRSSAVNDSRVTSMSISMEVFEALCNDSDAPIVLLFTKLDLLYDTIVRYPIRNYYRDASKDMTCHQACDFLADQFRSRDRRPYGELHIYFVDATDTQDLGWILRDARRKMFSPLSGDLLGV